MNPELLPGRLPAAVRLAAWHHHARPSTGRTTGQYNQILCRPALSCTAGPGGRPPDAHCPGSRSPFRPAGPYSIPMTGELSPVSRPGELSVRPEAGVPAEPGTQGEEDAQARLRASHEDRDRVVELLRVAAGDGRLTAEELDQRLEAALTARTYSELAVLTTDLPAPGARPAAGRPAVAAAAEVKDLIKIAVTSGTANRDGHWVVPRRMEVRVNSGNVKLDLTKAEIGVPTLDLDAEVKSGHLKVLTRPGIVVDTDDVEVRSGSVKVKTHRGSAVPAFLRIRITGQVGSGTLTVRPPRRSFLKWLLRRPYQY